ncbi:MAG: hypothetical protein EPN45_11285 [Rhizobiaceae bacterium]|nr:MAG: hypothetical protein EPN45_11285 [Rhizobiaceae bacterium]
MIRQDHVEPREIIVAEAIQNVVSELRMVDLADYVAFLRMGRIGNISDIVDSAAELYFMPGTLRFGHGGEAHVYWSNPPRIVLDLELRPRGATIYFTLALREKDAAVEVNYVAFDEPANDPLENTNFLRTAIREAAILPSSVG